MSNVSLDDLSPLKGLLDDFEKLVGGPGAGEQPADVYAYYNLMLRAQAAFREIGGRWGTLVQWGVLQKIPASKPALDEWEAFQPQWATKTIGGAFAGLSDMGRLRQQAAQLVSTENASAPQGFSPSYALTAVQVPTEAEQNQAVIDATTGTDREWAKLNKFNDEKLDQAKQLAEEAQKRLGELPSSIWGAIPWYVKLGGAAALVLVAVSAARR
jgi:hypothetical protein